MTGVVTLPGEATGVALIMVDAHGREPDRGGRRREHGPDLGPGARGAQAAGPDGAATSCSSGTRSGPGPPTRRCAWPGSPGRRRSSIPAPATGLGRSTLDLADILTPNEGELAVLVGPEGSPSVAGRRLLGAEPGSRAVLVSLGRRGAMLVAGRRARAIHAPRVEAVDTVGAGDALNGALAAGLAAGLDLAEAARRAVVAASLAVTRAGAREGMPTRRRARDGARPGTR